MTIGVILIFKQERSKSIKAYLIPIDTNLVNKLDSDLELYKPH